MCGWLAWLRETEEVAVAPGRMRVITQDRLGGPEVLHIGQRRVPEPLPTEVRVRVQAAGVNPVDWSTRAGKGMAPASTMCSPTSG